MRISDWSSDVCSSDLAQLLEDAPVDLEVGTLDQQLRFLALIAAKIAQDLGKCRHCRGGGQHERLLHVLEQAVDHGAERALHLLREAGKAREPRIERLEIGRASCRERVCQYV